ncbi:hypothetical protein [Rubrivivax benzoatilyticus]|uniref:Excisionase n=1 Tax=Rubrivivax benzoatilyticus TaxID=316997 RepID=A0ABX0HUM4_9BURK|nr:hypothetical protein [Rubrivivax benzoatilyticus]EGJ11967.1 hypothetical protein RBXJA2T_16632 [Rubrivivax benzoatilyticus JA2 = ATCC BAA-35]NHK97489.1 excisionase [Rubrivivax benzoatilyticus]NHL22816.1 excisionase [Rubrivivax benzoatilyticus]
MLTLPHRDRSADPTLDHLLVAPAPYVRIPLAAHITGYTEKAIRRKIDEGVWRVGKEYRKAPDGSVLISIAGYARWVETEKRR